MIKILQIPFTYHPDGVGGTEVFVEALAHRLVERGVESVIAAPGTAEACGEHGGLRVWRYPVAMELQDVSEMYGEGDGVAAAAFERILERERPAVVHLHALTRGVSLRMLRAARRRGIPVIYTYHTPTATCQRGTLLRWGDEVCDGMMTERLCAACALEGRGVNRVVARALAALPMAVGRLCGQAGLQGGVWTAVRACELTSLRHRCAREFLAEADHVVAVCEWVRAVLLRNGVPAEKITLSRQGLCQNPEAGRSSVRNSPPRCTGEKAALRVAFLGRLDPTKGVDVLLRALKGVSELKLVLDIYGIVQGEGGERFRRTLQALAAGDSRISFHPPLAASEVVSALGSYDVLAVPSQWLESGPMVVLEAFAAGVPVIGSRLGGIAELVRDGVDGLLVEPANVMAWTETWRRVCTEADLLPRLRAGVRAPRTIEAVAGEMANLYDQLLTQARAVEVNSSVAVVP